MAAMLLVGTAAQATTDHKHLDHNDRVANRYHHKQEIAFVQGGVKFFINTDGGIDFKILNRRTRFRQSNWYSYNTPGTYRYNRYHNLVRYDYYGRLKRVKSNYISYNRYNQVRRVGNIIIRYNRRGLVSQIGGLHIYYKKHGRIKFIEGDVHYRGCGYCGIDGCTVTHDPYFDLNRNQNHHNQDEYFYKNRKRKKKYRNDDDDDRDDD